MPTRSSSQSRAEQARFIFRGTVQQVNATTMSEVPASDRTATVRVDDILHATDALMQFHGREITLQWNTARTLKEGQQAVFYTNPSLYGESLAVQLLHSHPVGQSPLVLSAEAKHPTENLRHRDLS